MTRSLTEVNERAGFSCSPAYSRVWLGLHPGI